MAFLHKRPSWKRFSGFRPLVRIPTLPLHSIAINRPTSILIGADALPTSGLLLTDAPSPGTCHCCAFIRGCPDNRGLTERSELLNHPSRRAQYRAVSACLSKVQGRGPRGSLQSPMQPRLSNVSVAKPNPNHVPPAESSDSTMNAVLVQITIDRVQRRRESSGPVNRPRVQLRSVV